MKRINFSKGYSLIELVIYISLFVLIAVVVIQSLIYAMKTYSTARNYRTLQRNAETTLSRLTTEIRSAKAVSTSSSSFGTTSGVLALTGIDSAGLPYNPTFSLDNGIARVVVGGVSTPLASSEVTFSELTFWNIITTNSDAVKIKTTLSTTRPPFITKTFYTTVILRE
jgi:type II secretory pathway pseudopilin PulG